MALLISILLFFTLLTWNVGEFIKKYKAFPKKGEVLKAHVLQENKMVFKILFYVCLAFFVLFLYSVLHIGLLPYIERISLGDKCKLLLFVAFTLSFLIRLLISVSSSMNIQDKYIWSLWKVRMKDAKSKVIRRYLFVTNSLLISSLICLLTEIFVKGV